MMSDRTFFEEYNVITLGAAATACGRCRRWTQATALLACCTSAEPLGDTSHRRAAASHVRLEVNVFFTSTAINALSKENWGPVTYGELCGVRLRCGARMPSRAAREAARGEPLLFQLGDLIDCLAPFTRLFGGDEALLLGVNWLTWLQRRRGLAYETVSLNAHASDVEMFMDFNGIFDGVHRVSIAFRGWHVLLRQLVGPKISAREPSKALRGAEPASSSAF